MRHAATLVALACATTVGAQELLPLVQPKGSEPAPVNGRTEVSTPILLVDLPAEPLRSAVFDEEDALTAARRNDFRAFEAAYAKSRPSGALADLHNLWTWSESDRLGAFYSDEMYRRFASAYPGFADYITQYRIVDRNGNVFYPTAETRAFLIREASSGNAPRPVTKIRIARAQTTTPAPMTSSTTKPATAVRRASKKHHRIIKAEVQPAPVPQQLPSMAVAAPHPALRATLSLPGGERGDEAEVAKAQVVDSPTSSRGIFLIILGLVGIGVLTTMLRAPKAEEKIAAEPTPFRGSSEEPDEHRATGSHG